MARPMGGSKQGCLRVNFDHRLKLEFHGSTITITRDCIRPWLDARPKRPMMETAPEALAA